MKIGWIGLGRMGAAMAARLIKDGHTVALYNRTASKAEALAALGGRTASSPREAAAEAEVLVTMLSDDQALESVLAGEKGALQGLPSGAVHLSMSTIGVDLARRLEPLHEKAGVRLVGAPVFGRPDAAEAGKLFILAGGDSGALKRCEPLFKVLAQKVFPAGPSAWHAHLTKVLGNFMLVSAVESLAEAMVLARRSGLEAGPFLEALTGSAFSAPFYAGYGGRMVEGRYEPAGFGLPLALKDVRLALQAASAAGGNLPLAVLLEKRTSSALARGWDRLDLAALAKAAEEDGGAAADG